MHKHMTTTRNTAGRRHMGAARLSGILLVLVLAFPWPLMAQSEGESVTLNLKDADIQALIETVSDVTGRNFIVDPRVSARVTVMSSQPMTPDSLYETFLSILAVHGYAAVPSGDSYKILPASDAKQSGADAPPVQGAPRDEIVTHVIEVENVPAAQLVPILRPLIPQDGHLAAYPPSNSLIISDRQGNVDRLLNIIRRIDRTSDDEFELVQLEHANAVEVARILQGVSSDNEDAGALKIMPDARTNSILLGGEESRRVRMRALIAHLDAPTEDTGNTQVVYLRHADAESLASILENVAGNDGGGGEGEQNGERVSVVPDPETNSLVINAPPETMRSFQTVIRQLDIRRAQVLVEAIIAEIGTDRANQLGVQWVFDASRTGAGGLVNFGGAGSPILGLADFPDIQGDFEGASLALGAVSEDEDQVDFAALLRALQGDSDTNIISTPMLVTMDNEEAEISVGQEVPFLTGQFSERGAGGSSDGGGLNPFQTIDRRDVGVSLKITPRINEGDAVELAIEQEVSSLSGSTGGAVDLVTNRRSLSTRVIADDEQIIVLGGLIDDEVQESSQRVPILGSIPVIGRLFRSDSVTRSKRNLMVFLRPSIIRDGLDAARYTTEKYNYMRAMQMHESDRNIELMRHELRPLLPELDLDESMDLDESVAPVHPDLEQEANGDEGD